MMHLNGAVELLGDVDEDPGRPCVKSGWVVNDDL